LARRLLYCGANLAHVLQPDGTAYLLRASLKRQPVPWLIPRDIPR